MVKPFATFVCSLLALPAVGATRITVLPFTGLGAPQAHSLMVEAVCDVARCVPAAEVSSRGKPDWAKVRKEQVSLVISGKISKKKVKTVLELNVLKGPGDSIFKNWFQVDEKGRLSKKTSEAAAQALVALVSSPDQALAQTSPQYPPPDRDPESSPENPNDSTPTAAEGEPLSRAERLKSPEPTPEISERPSSPSGPGPLLILEAGSEFFSRNFTYNKEATTNLRGYQAPFIVAPRISAELYPLTSLTTGVPAGLGVEAGFALSVGLKSRRLEGPAHPTALTRLDVATKLRFKPVPEATVIPSLGFRSTRFSTGQASDGSMIDGLPGVSYSALVIGLGGELLLADNKVVTFARFALLPVLSAGEIIGPDYFRDGSASALEGAVGVGLKLKSNLEPRLTASITRYGLTFKAEPSDAYVAAGAVDQYLGVNLALRYTY